MPYLHFRTRSKPQINHKKLADGQKYFNSGIRKFCSRIENHIPITNLSIYIFVTLTNLAEFIFVRRRGSSPPKDYRP